MRAKRAAVIASDSSDRELLPIVESAIMGASCLASCYACGLR
jgi:hypothetical protein